MLYSVSIRECLSVNVVRTVLNSILDMMLEDTDVKPVLVIKYVDDIFGIVKIQDVDRMINTLHHRLVLTYELEKDGMLGFLDLIIIRDSQGICICWHNLIQC